MQENPSQNPISTPPTTTSPSQLPSLQTPPNSQPPRKKSPFKMVGLGCGGLFVLFIAFALLSPDAPKTQTTTAATTTANSSKTANDLTPYFGKWTGQDSTTISIRGDGKGDFDGGNVKVSGGGVEVDNAAKTLKISSFFGIGKEWKIDAPPKSANGTSEMKLNGVVYRRSGGFDPNDATSSTRSSFDSSVIPSRAEQLRLTKNTLLDFDKAVRAANFATFYNGISQTWKDQTSAAELTKAFQPFVTQKIRIASAVQTLSPTFSPAPSLDDKGVLTLEGFYPSKPSRLTFRLKFVPEDDAWKLFGIRVNVVPQN